MPRYFSASTKGFYDTDFVTYALPADAVEISPDEHQSLLVAQSSGHVIRVDTAGRPTAVPRPINLASAILAGGLAVTSKSGALPPIVWATSALPDFQVAVSALSPSLPAGAATWPVRDAEGVAHDLTPDQLRAVCVVLAAFVAQGRAAAQGLNVPPLTAAAVIP